MRAVVKVGLVAWNALMALWFVSALVAASESTSECTTELCEDATAVGTGVGIVVILFVAALGDVVLGIFWLVSRPDRRPCPVCGRGVPTGTTVCPCGHDFRSTAASTGARWAPDLMGRYELRWWDGARWTDDVSTAGQQQKDPDPLRGSAER